MNVNIVLFDDFNALDALGPAEVFGKFPEHFHIRYLSASGDVINSAQGLKVWTDSLRPEEIDGVFLIPGGKGARRLLWREEALLDLIRDCAKNAELCMMVGNGSALAAQTGLLYRRKIADIAEDKNWNRMFTAGIDRLASYRIVLDGKFYSCRDTLSGIGMALFAIEELLDISLAEKAATAVGYAWDQDAEDVFR